ncbi:MAG: hypothetical protein HZY79_00615 [Rhodoblastus sp.]|nr:MAG: hypothetical protein HZY79_00615 [Rhodoblastus sp.]
MRADAERVTCATAALCELAPFDLWVAVHFFPGRDFETTQQIFARTTGLLPFIGREIECGPYAKEPSGSGRSCGPSATTSWIAASSFRAANLSAQKTIPSAASTSPAPR